MDIKYGKIKLDGFGLVSYAIFQNDSNQTVELICPPYKGLYVRIDGKIFPPGSSEVRQYVMLWTKVAGWLGTDQLLNSLKN